jgi:hypothetical protein
VPQQASIPSKFEESIAYGARPWLVATPPRQGKGQRNRDAYGKASRWTAACYGSFDCQALGVTRSVVDKTWENGCESTWRPGGTSN